MAVVEKLSNCLILKCCYVNIHAKIEPGNAFRLLVKIAKYTADVEYGGQVEMVDQEHELLLDRSVGYSLAQFHEDLSSKIIWGPSQTLSTWVLDTHIAVEVTIKAGYENRESSVPSKVSITANPARSGVTIANVDGASTAGTNA
jgi:hypothetical protein